jgi:alcohol dehydrogenase YqhD (iron-dependent ADH family)
MNHDVNRFAKVATRVWGCEMDFDHPEVTALEGINAFQNFLISLGMPKNFEELGAKEEDIPKLAEICCRGDGRDGTISGFVTLTEEDVQNIYRMML